MNISNN